MVSGACWEEGKNASPKNTVHKKICIAISRERVTESKYFLKYCPVCFSADMLVREVDEETRPAFIFVGELGGDAEVLEDFSPLSTNATYWKTCQDTFEGAMSQCPLRDACGGCAKGKYSQISMGGEDAFRIDTQKWRAARSFLRGHGIIHKLLGRRG